MPISSDFVEALIRLAITGALGGVLGGLLGSFRSSLLSSLLFGAIGGLTLSAIIRIGNVDPFSDVAILNAGEDFSYAWALIGGFFLGYVTTRSAGR